MIPQAWQNAIRRHKRLYSWLGLSAAMVGVILLTSLGARPGVLSLLFLALVGVSLAGATILVVDWENSPDGVEAERR